MKIELGVTMKKVKILFIAANPQGTVKLALDEEIREITNKVRLSKGRDKLDIVSAWAVRPDDLLQYLNQYQPQIVHFSGHGSEAGDIILVDTNNNTRPVMPEALKALFTTLKDNIQVVFLNACYSQIQGKAINEVIDYVVGMNKAVGDKAAIVFASSFYRALGFGRTIQDAFDQAKTALLLEDIPEEETPELLIKPGASSNKAITSVASKRKGTPKKSHMDESMWIALTEIIENRWKDKPRGDLVQSVIHLRNSMINCQQWFEKYKNALDHSKVGKLPYPNPRFEWIRSLTILGKAVASLDQVFSIFSPETREHIRSYFFEEDLALAALGSLIPAAEELGGWTDFDIENGKLEATFNTALEKLNNFIKENFKPEEIFSVKDLYF